MLAADIADMHFLMTRQRRPETPVGEASDQHGVSMDQAGCSSTI